MNDDSTTTIARNDGRTIARNTLYNLLGRGLPLLVGLATTPFVVRGLGETRFGLFSIGLAVISSFFMFDLGLGRAVAKYAAAYRAGGREREVPALLWNAVYLQAVLGIGAGLVLAAMTPWLVGGVFAIPDDLAAESAVVFYLLAATVVLCLTEFPFAGALEAYQRFGLINAVRAPINIVSLLYILQVAQGGHPLWHFFLFFLGSRFAITGLLLYLCRRVIPGLFQGMGPSLASVEPLFHFGKWVTLSNLVAPALLYADRFLLGALGTLGMVAFYTAPFQVLERLLIIPGTLTSTLFPAISALESSRATGEIQRLAARTLHYLVCVMGLGGVALAAAAPWVVWVFFGEAYLPHSVAVFRILLAGIVINALALIPFSIVQGCGRPDITAKLHVLEFPIHLALLYLGYQLAGLPGVALAWMLRVTLDAGLLTLICVMKGWLDLRHLAALGTVRNAGVFLGSGILLSQLQWGASGLHMALACVLVLLVAGYTWKMGLGAEQRREILHFVRRQPDTDGGV